MSEDRREHSQHTFAGPSRQEIRDALGRDAIGRQTGATVITLNSGDATSAPPAIEMVAFFVLFIIPRFTNRNGSSGWPRTAYPNSSRHVGWIPPNGHAGTPSANSTWSDGGAMLMVGAVVPSLVAPILARDCRGAGSEIRCRNATARSSRLLMVTFKWRPPSNDPRRPTSDLRLPCHCAGRATRDVAGDGRESIRNT